MASVCASGARLVRAHVLRGFVLSGFVVAVATVTASLVHAAPRADLPRPRGYVATRASQPITIDGQLSETAWASAPWTDLFVDIEGEARPKPPLATRAKMLWDDTYFYIAADLAEPHLWSNITQHDAVIFREHDFEVFIDPNADSHEYFEFEINARGTFWDLMLPKPYRAGGHAVDSWELTGARSAIHLNGTLNNASDLDRGWMVELAFPWAALSIDERKPTVPKDGDQWRVNFSRVEWPVDVVGNSYRAKPGAAEHNWVWSPQYVVDMHRPERWGYVQFSSKPAPLMPDVSWPARQWLQSVYEAQRDFFAANHRYSSSLIELKIAAPTGELALPTLEITSSMFEASVTSRAAGVWHIRHDALVWPTPSKRP